MIMMPKVFCKRSEWFRMVQIVSLLGISTVLSLFLHRIKWMKFKFQFRKWWDFLCNFTLLWSSGLVSQKEKHFSSWAYLAILGRPIIVTASSSHHALDWDLGWNNGQRHLRFYCQLRCSAVCYEALQNTSILAGRGVEDCDQQRRCNGGGQE